MILLFYGKLVLFDHRNLFAYDRIFFYPNIVIIVIIVDVSSLYVIIVINVNDNMYIYKNNLPEHNLMLYQLCIVLLYVMCVYHISFLYRMSFFPLERLPFSMYNNDDKLYYIIIVIRHIV